MRQEYDFSKALKNPYAAKLTKQITIRLDDCCRQVNFGLARGVVPIQK